ncbi:hypothetical protein AB5I39_16630 [Sphingomonas sp. MMS24-J45]|uniref:hypothetical protein n=1 Tax=Sphingomonas sp. MMS24-J45 TaxID=3238806 RepID=UPI00384E8A05
MPYDQALSDQDRIETQARDTNATASTAEIVAMLRDLSRAAREHFSTDAQRVR